MYIQQKISIRRIISLGLSIVIFGVAAWSTRWNTTHAAPVYSFDCSLTTNSQNNLSWTIWLYQKDWPLNTKTLQVAFTHLKNSCDNKVWWAESRLLFDHLLDIWFRKLDAYEDATLRYNQEADKKWQERQDKIKEFTDTKKTTTPEDIINTFVDFWGDNPQSKPTLNAITCEVENYDTLNLYKRYLATCEAARCIAIKKASFVWDDAFQSSAWLVQTNMCATIATNRRNTELAFVRQLTVRAGGRIVESSFTSYTNTYFKSRWSDLYESFTMFDQWLIFVNRKIQEWTATCSF